MPQDPTFRFLDSVFLREPRNALAQTRVTLNTRGLTLAESSAPDSPVRLDAPDGSLGRLLLPRGFAVDASGKLYLLDEAKRRILRLDEQAGSFVELPWLGGEGRDARQFLRPVQIAIAGGDLYVADAGHREVQIFSLGNLALRSMWDFSSLTDICAGAAAVYILDGESARVYRHVPGTSRAPQHVLSCPAQAGRWSRLAVDSEERLYLLGKPEGGEVVLTEYTAAGEVEREFHVAGDVRDRFPAPPVTSRGPTLFAWRGGFIDREGKSVKVSPTASLGPAPFETSGVWMAGPRAGSEDGDLAPVLDSEIYRCTWHRVEVEAELPPGASLVLRTYTEETLRSDKDIADMEPTEWDTAGTLVGGLQPDGSAHQSTDFLVQSIAGRYLWLRVDLHGAGFSTPTLESLRIHFPRETYLDYLPALYSADEEGRRFLERFLAVFKTEWDSLEQRFTSIAAHFDPQAVPAELADWLATWVAMPVEQAWSLAEKRHALSTIPRTYGETGTMDALQKYVRVYLENLGTPLPEGQPAIIEGFQRRRARAAAAQREDGFRLPWSSPTLDRLQLGVHSRVGEARLVSEGTPQTDLFQAFAHRFELFVPAASLRNAEDERSLRLAVEAAKPAHTRYELQVVGARQRAGVQSSVGVDTVLGAYPQLRLGSLEAAAEQAPSAPPQGRLGYDTVLAATQSANAGFCVPPGGARIGITTALR